MTAEEIEGSGGQFMNPCDGFSCGDNGSCVALNGAPTCACDDDYAAVAQTPKQAQAYIFLLARLIQFEALQSIG